MKLPGKFKDKLNKGGAEPVRKSAATSQSGGASAQVDDMSEEEYRRFEELFKTRLGDHVLAMSGLEWHEFDVKVFLEFLDACNMSTVCRKFDPNAVVREQEAGRAPSAWQKQAETRAAKQRQREAYRSIKNEMEISEVVLRMLGTTADNVSISGFSNALRAALDDSALGFASKAILKKPASGKERNRPQERPRVFLAAKDIIMSGERRSPEARMKDTTDAKRADHAEQAVSAANAAGAAASAAAANTITAAEAFDMPIHDTAAVFRAEQLALAFGQESQSAETNSSVAKKEQHGVSTPYSEFGQDAKDVWFDEDIIDLEVYDNPQTVDDGGAASSVAEDEDAANGAAGSGAGSDDGERDARSIDAAEEIMRSDENFAGSDGGGLETGSSETKLGQDKAVAQASGSYGSSSETIEVDHDGSFEDEFYDELESEAKEQQPRRMIEMFGF